MIEALNSCLIKSNVLSVGTYYRMNEFLKHGCCERLLEQTS